MVYPPNCLILISLLPFRIDSSNINLETTGTPFPVSYTHLESFYNEAVTFFYEGHDNGSLTNYIMESGQCQESGRDQNLSLIHIYHN